MIIIKPMPVTAAVLTSNVPEMDYPSWSAGTNYLVGDLAIYNHRIYESLQHPNTGHQPDTSPTFWLDIGATNRYRMFDAVINSVTSNPDTIDVTITTNSIINGVALFGLSAATVQVQLIDPIDGIVYDETRELADNDEVVDWWTYFFTPVAERKTEIVFLDLPTYPGASARMVADNTGSDAMVAEMVVGMQRVIGVTNYDTTIGIRDFSRKETDEFGNTVIIERAFSKTADYDVVVETPTIASVQRFLASIRATPSVYIGDENRSDTINYGIYRSFSIVYTEPSISGLTIEVEGLT